MKVYPTMYELWTIFQQDIVRGVARRIQGGGKGGKYSPPRMPPKKFCAPDKGYKEVRNGVKSILKKKGGIGNLQS